MKLVTIKGTFDVSCLERRVDQLPRQFDLLRREVR